MTEGAGGASVVCMLAEGSYFHGAATLSNSLARHGFTGTLVVGFRGALPSWARDLPASGGAQLFAPGIRIRFVPMPGDWHLTNLKAQLLRRAAGELPGWTTLYYFDVDIVLKCAWAHFVRWAAQGVVLALDLAETYMPPEHVFRREWRALAARAGYACRPVSGYVNGGCLGLGPDRLGFVEVWDTLLQRFAAEGADMTRITAPGGPPEYAKMDQDILNAAVMASDADLALLGSEAMDNFPSAQIMSHAMVFRKPWLRNYVLDALKGFPPDDAHLAFWRYVDHPVASFTPAALRRKRAQLGAARLIGKLRRRTVRDW